MPHEPSQLNEGVPIVAQLEKQLYYITKTIQPFFSKGQGHVSQDPVSRNKLTNLWLHKRKKAIHIIKNDNKWPIKVHVEINQAETEAFYQNEKNFILENEWDENNAIGHQQEAERYQDEVPPFTSEEIQSVLRKLPNGKSPGLDGVRYEDVKKEYDDKGVDIRSCFNTYLINKKVPSSWKHDIIQRIPKKNFQQQDLTTLRDICLSSVIYKIFSRCIIQRILPLIEPKIEFWQRAFLQGRNRQDLIFSLKTALDDFKHISTKLHVLFIDFADAYGSIKHDKMIQTLSEYDIPATYCKIIKNIYEGACFQVICGNTLSKKIYITRGTKTGDPLGVIIFLMVLNRVLQPAFNYSLIALSIQNERKINPLPIQAYADDIAMVSYDFRMLKKMLEISEPLFNDAGLKVKGPKCALFYERRSGNNWYKGKNDRQPVIEIQGEKIETYKRSQAYKYLGKSLSICGEDPKQVEAFIEEFKETLNKIDASSLPIPLKLSAFNNMALAKILHHFDNTRIEEQQLGEMDSKVSCVVRNMFGLYPKTTDEVFFIGRLHGGLGIKKPSNVYRATRISNLVNMLNHEEENIRYIARESLSLDMRARGVRATNGERTF